MLIDPVYKANDIVAIRITGGDEVIAKFIEEDNTGITVSKPLALTMTKDGLGMTQYIMMADFTKNFNFNKSTVVTIGKAHKAATDNYIKGTTGIQPASSVPNIQGA